MDNQQGPTVQHRELCTMLCGSLNGKGVWGRTTESLCCSPETITTLLTGYVLCLVAQSCLTLCNPMDCSLPGSSVHGDSPGKNTAVGCHSLLQGMFPTQGSNPALPHCRWILYQLNHQGSPRILEWVAYLISRWSSWSRNRTRVSCITCRFFTSWVNREDLTGKTNIKIKSVRWGKENRCI